MSDKDPNIKKPKRVLHRTRRFCGVSFKVFIEVFLILLMLVLVGVGGLLYAISKDQLDVEFAKRHLTETINSEVAPYYIEVGALDIVWENIFERPVFVISDISFLNQSNETLLTLEDLSFTFARSQMIVGELLPREIKVRGLDLHFVRLPDGVIQLGFVSGPSYIIYDGQTNGQGTSFTTLGAFYEEHLEDLFNRGFLKGLRTLQIMNSAVVFEDISKGYAISFPDIDALLKPSARTLDLGLDMQVQNGLERDLLSVSLLYDTKFRDLQTSLETQNFNPFLWASLFSIEGVRPENSSVKIDSKLQASFNDHLNLQSAELDTRTTDGQLDIPALYDHPFEFQELVINGFFNRKTMTFDLKESILNAYGLNINLDASLPLPQEGTEKYNIPIAFGISEFTVPIPEKAFPDRHEDKPIYRWLTSQLETGTIENFRMDLDLTVFKTPEDEWDGDLAKLYGEFDYKDLRARYMTDMIPISNASGHAIIDSGPDQMTITAESGNFDDIKLQDITILIIDLLADKKSTVDLDFKADGSFKNLLEFLSRDPINIEKDIHFDRKSVEGNANLHVKLRAPTRDDLPIEDIMIDIEGNMTNILIPKLVKELDVSGEDLEFSIKDGLMRAEGDGQLAGREGRFIWQQYLKSAGKPFKMKVNANMLADANLRKHFGVEIDDFITGPASVDLVYTSQSDGRAELDATADLTPAQIHFTPLGYLKPSGEPASAGAKATLQDDVAQSVRNLTVTGPDLSISNASLEFAQGDLKKGIFPKNTVAETTASLEFTYESINQLVMDIKGQSFDARTILADTGEEEYVGPAIRSFMEVDEILTFEEEKVSKTKVFVNMLNNGDVSQFEMDGTSGNGNVYIRYKPGPDGSPNLRAEFADAGAALKAFGMYQNVRGGTLTVTGTSSDKTWKGNVSGNFLLQNFSVRNAPVLAKLVNAMSLPGLGQLLGNDGIVFSKLTADFKWNARPEGALITVRDGRTSGSELGLTFEGNIDRSTQTLNMEGTIVPVSTLNNLIGDIPLLGPVITGGTGSLIAATYKIKGPYQNSEVRINPLSALAPGIVRKILFED